MPGVVGVVAQDAGSDIVVDVRFALNTGTIPAVYLVTASGTTVSTDFNAVDPALPPAGYTSAPLVTPATSSGPLLPAPGVAAAPTGDGGVVLVIPVTPLEDPAAKVAISARTPTAAASVPGISPAFDSAFGRVAEMVGGDDGAALLLLVWAGVQDPGELLLINFLLATCEPPNPKVAVQPDGKPPVAGHPTPAINVTCAATVPPLVASGGTGTPAANSLCPVPVAPPPDGVTVYCGLKPTPPDASRTLIFVGFDQPIDPINGVSGVFAAPLLDINAKGDPSSGFKARKGFPFDTLQGSTSYLKVLVNNKNDLELQSLNPRAFAPKPTSGVAVAERPGCCGRSRDAQRGLSARGGSEHAHEQDELGDGRDGRYLGGRPLKPGQPGSCRCTSHRR